jgi:hypothetical protein
MGYKKFLYEDCCTLWMEEITKINKGTVVAIDGKTMCGTADESA